jgi:hypothetical protein
MPHCSIINKRYLLKGRGVVDYIYLTITSGFSQFISNAYIVKSIKNQKRQTLGKGFALVEKRYHKYF